jgi:hypothetical protein
MLTMDDIAQNPLVLNNKSSNGTIILPGCKLFLQYKCEDVTPNQRIIRKSRTQNTNYDLAKIKELLTEGFNQQELLAFCHSTPEFKDLCDERLKDDAQKPDIILEIMKFAKQRRYFDIVLKWAKGKNPRMYEEFEPYHIDIPDRQYRDKTDGDITAQPTEIAAARIFEYDVFICHATEDKEDFVVSLAQALSKAGVKVWYDGFTLKWGDNLLQSINKGLARSRYGIVVLSKNFFNKRWPQHELEGLFAREIRGQKVILPIRHNITTDEIVSYAPTLANKLALDTSRHSLNEIVREAVKMLEKDL